MILNLLRVRQYYKNLVIFLPLIFSLSLFSIPSWTIMLYGFIVLCMISSGSYILNDILDRKKDRAHPEKKTRPIASGKVPVMVAAAISFLLYLSGLAFSIFLSKTFFLTVIAFTISGLIYTLWGRDEPFLDILLISINFVLRAVSGAFLIGVAISPWLILCPFFLALFLAVSKRRAEASFLGRSAISHRPSLKAFTPALTSGMMAITTSLLIISYSLYCFLSVQNKLLMITLPIVLYGIFRYIYLVESGSAIARHPEKALLDLRLMFSGLAWLVAVLLVIYA